MQPFGLRQVLRSLRRAPAFTLAAVATLALGIGANTAIFSAVNGVLLHPLAYPDPDRLVVVWGRHTTIGRETASLPDFLDWRAQARSFEALGAMTATTSLAVGSVGPVLVRELVTSREILRLSDELIRPFYRERSAAAVEWLQASLDGVEHCIHRPEGAFFLWLWLPGLPITSAELYRRLKARGVLVLSGHHFFPGLKAPWRHRDECLRISYAQDPESVRAGLAIVGEEVRRAYDRG